jgi:hypothetical protein
MNDKNLLAVTPDGITQLVEESAVSDVIGGPIDFIRVMADVGFYIDDEGMLNGSLLNVAASIFAGRPIWGRVVLTGWVDEEGDVLAPPEEAMRMLDFLAQQWAAVTSNAVLLNQDVNTNVANTDDHVAR